MKQWKFIRLMMFIFTLVLILSACKAPTNETSKPTDNNSQTTNNNNSNDKKGGGGDGNYTIGISFPAADHGWLGAMIKNAEAEAKKHTNFKYKLVTAKDPAKQTSDIEDLITQKVDAIVMLPIESAAMTPIADKVAKANIPLVVIDRGLLTENYRTYIGGDNYGIGYQDAKYLVQKLIEKNGEPKGKVVEITGVPSTVTDLRKKGFRDYIKDYPGIEIVASQPGDFTREKALSAMENILLAQKKIDAVFSHDDDMTIGIVQAIKDARRQDEMFIVSSAGMKEIYQMMKEKSKPEIVVSVKYPSTMGATAVYLGTRIVEGKGLDGFWEKDIPHNIVLEATPVTPENVDQYYDANSNF